LYHYRAWVGVQNFIWVVQNCTKKLQNTVKVKFQFYNNWLMAVLGMRIPSTAIEKSDFLGGVQNCTKKSTKYCQGLVLLFKSGRAGDTDLSNCCFCSTLTLIFSL
jgi:hypothetical protein